MFLSRNSIVKDEQTLYLANSICIISPKQAHSYLPTYLKLLSGLSSYHIHLPFPGLTKAILTIIRSCCCEDLFLSLLFRPCHLSLYIPLLAPSSVLHQTHAASFPFPFSDPLVCPSPASYLIPHWPTHAASLNCPYIRLSSKTSCFVLFLMLTPTSFSSFIPQTSLCCHTATNFRQHMIYDLLWSTAFYVDWYADPLSVRILSSIWAAYFPRCQSVQYYL